MPKTKVIDETTQWKGFVSLIKTFAPIATGFVKGDNNEIFLKLREERNFVETIAIMKDVNTIPFYQWLCSDIDSFLGQLKANDIKIKGTMILDEPKSVRVLKDMEEKCSFYKLNEIQGQTKKEQAFSVYRVLPRYFYAMGEAGRKWIPLDEQQIESLLSKKPVKILMRFDDPNEMVGTVEMILSPSIFPLLKKANSVEFSLMAADRTNEKYYIGIREDHDEFVLYSLIAIMMVDDD